MDKLFLQKRTPVWFMRQAGRYLPEYKRLRSTEKTFLNLCFNSDKAAKISLQPIERFDLDFIILFSDILVVPHALGQFVDFKENVGPVLEPIKNKHDLDFKNLAKNLMILDPVFKTIKIIKKNNKEKKFDWFLWRTFYCTYIYDRRRNVRESPKSKNENKKRKK